MIKQIALTLLFLATTCAFGTEVPPMTNLLAGDDLTKHWETPKDPNCWVLKDGILTVKNNEKQQGDILHTKQHFTDVICEFEFKFGSGRIDSGVHIRNDKDQIQIGESGSLKRDMTASPYIPGKGYPVEAAGVKDLLKMDDWNTLRIRAIGPKYTTWLNGKEVMNYSSASASEKGPLGIQLHAKRAMWIFYRNFNVVLPEAK